MLVLEPVIVMDVYRGDAVAKCGDGIGNPNGHVRMAQIQANSNLVKVAGLEDDHKVLGCRCLTQQVLHQQTHAQGSGKRAQMLERNGRIIHGSWGPSVGSLAEVHNQVAKGDMLGGLDGPLDLVHSVDAAGFLRMQQVDPRSAGAAHIAVRVKRRVHRPNLELVGTKPAGQLCDMIAAGVIEVLAGGKYFDSLRSGPGGKLHQPWLQTLVQKQVCRQDSQHVDWPPARLEQLSKPDALLIFAFCNYSRAIGCCATRCIGAAIDSHRTAGPSALKVEQAMIRQGESQTGNGARRSIPTHAD